MILAEIIPAYGNLGIEIPCLSSRCVATGEVMDEDSEVSARSTLWIDEAREVTPGDL